MNSSRKLAANERKQNTYAPRPSDGWPDPPEGLVTGEDVTDANVHGLKGSLPHAELVQMNTH